METWGFIKGQALNKLTISEDDFVCLVWPSKGNYFLLIMTFNSCCLPVNPRGVFGISSDGDGRMERKVKTQKTSLGLQQNPKKFLNQNLTLKISHANFVVLKSSRKQGLS